MWLHILVCPFSIQAFHLAMKVEVEVKVEVDKNDPKRTQNPKSPLVLFNISGLM